MPVQKTNNKRNRTSKKIEVDRDERRTPKLLFENLEAALKIKFDLDATANKQNALCKKYINKKQNALGIETTWDGNVYCNPPYSKAAGGVGAFLQKGYQQVAAGNARLVAFLITLDSGVGWYREWSGFAWEIWELASRVKFDLPGVDEKAGAEFSSSIFIYRKGGLKGSPKVRLWDWRENKFIW